LEAAVAVARLGGTLVMLISLLAVGGHAVAGPQGMAAVAATLVAGLLVVAAALATRAAALTLAAPVVSRSLALREKAWCAAFLRQRDPDAAGRPRPRAPSAASAAA
jgi:hypothetical protein